MTKDPPPAALDAPAPRYAPTGEEYHAAFANNRFLVLRQCLVGLDRWEIDDGAGRPVLHGRWRRTLFQRLLPNAAAGAILVAGFAIAVAVATSARGSGLLIVLAWGSFLVVLAAAVALAARAILQPPMDIEVAEDELGKEVVLRVRQLGRWFLPRRHVEVVRADGYIVGTLEIPWLSGLTGNVEAHLAKSSARGPAFLMVEVPRARAIARNAVAWIKPAALRTDFRITDPSGVVPWGTLVRRTRHLRRETASVGGDPDGMLDRRVVVAAAILLSIPAED